jgi:hypothetical protein
METRNPIYLTTDAQCVDEKVGTLREAFVMDQLSEGEARLFGAHLQGCLRCSFDVLNAETLARHEITGNERLTPPTVIDVPAPPCSHWQHVTAKMMAFRKG